MNGGLSHIILTEQARLGLTTAPMDVNMNTKHFEYISLEDIMECENEHQTF
jgi:hypothetical protein